MKLYTTLFQFVMSIVAKYKIDESHGLSHSFQILTFAHSIYEHEVIKCPEIAPYEKIVYISAIIHDMCDHKYMDVDSGLETIVSFLSSNEIFQLSDNDVIAIRDIINTMSYSKVKMNGFPNLGNYQKAYHIVREADLLCAYDFDRCMVYHMHTHNTGIENAFHDSSNLFNVRVFRHESDGLLTTEYSKQQSQILETQSRGRIEKWSLLLKI